MEKITTFTCQKQASAQVILSIFPVYFLNNQWLRAITEVVCHTIHFSKEYKGNKHEVRNNGH